MSSPFGCAGPPEQVARQCTVPLALVEPSSFVGEEELDEPGLDVDEREPGIEVDVVVDHLTQPQEGNACGAHEVDARCALEPDAVVVGSQPRQCRCEHCSTVLDVGDQLGQRAGGAGVDVGVPGLVARVHRLSGAVDRGPHERGHPVGVAGEVGEHVAP